MNATFRFEGIYTPLVTPYDSDGSVRWDGLADVIDHLLSRGVHGFISGGSTGENYAQTVAERIDVARFSRERIAGRVPFVVGTGATLTADSLALAEAAREMGADCLLLASPPYAVPTDDENADNALAVQRAAGLPAMLYNYPHRTGTMMGRTFLDRVAGNPDICGIKESSGDINRLHMLARDYPDIQVGCGMDDQALEFFAWGAPFWVCGGSNFLPDEHIALYEACVLRGDFAIGRQIMSAMMPLMNLLEQGGKFIQTIKQGVSMNGIEASAVRAPLSGLNEQEKHELHRVVRALRREVAAITRS